MTDFNDSRAVFTDLLIRWFTDGCAISGDEFAFGPYTAAVVDEGDAGIAAMIDFGTRVVCAVRLQADVYVWRTPPTEKEIIALRLIGED